MNRKFLIGVALVALVALAGCNDAGPSGEQLAQDTGVNVSGVTVGESYAYEVKLTEKNQYQLVQKRPPFVMQDSMERQNLIERYQYLNDQNNVHHVYMMSHDGKVIDYEVAQGKVSSVNSKLTNDVQIVASNRCLRVTNDGSEGSCFKTVESPQMDGSYGTNGAAIFFFTTDGHYVEWNGLYLVSEEPKNIQTKVSLVDTVDTGGQTGNETAENESA